MFFRIVFLPLINFADDFTPPTEDKAPDAVMEHYTFLVELWRAMTDWTVTPSAGSSGGGGSTSAGTTRFASFCMRHSRSFEAWDSLHGNIGSFSPKMLSAFRVIRSLLHEYFQCPNLPDDMFEALSAAYFFMVSPRHHRSVVTDYLLEMGRWIAEQRPLLVLQCTNSFHAMLAQDFIPEGLRCWRMQRWSASVLSAALSATLDQAITVKEAARFFDVIHQQIWELLAVASCDVVAAGRGSMDSDSDASARQVRFDASSFAHSMLGSNASGTLDLGKAGPGSNTAERSTSTTSGGVAREPNWQLELSVWTATTEQLRLHGPCMAEHLHALFLALAGLSRICPNVKERGIICLANAVRTLSKDQSETPPGSLRERRTACANEFSAGLIATATLCMKLLRYPPISGLNTMPLHVLLGIHVLGVPSGVRGKSEAAPSPS
jgi:hypothetical protein